MAKLQRVRLNKPSSMPNIMLDTLTNLVSGMGTEGKDKSFHTHFGLSLLHTGQLEAAYRGDWIARKVVDIPAEDAIREWRSWQADSKDITALEDVESDLRIQLKTGDALTKARLYGGAALVMGVNQGEASEELIIEKVRKDDLKFIHALSRNELNAGPINADILSPYYGEPEYYEVSVKQPAVVAQVDKLKGSITQGARIHPSRVIRFVGRGYPDKARSPDSWGDSILQAVHEAIIQTGTVIQSMSQLVQEAKLDVISIPNLSDNLSNKDYSNRLQTRFGLSNLMKSLYSTMLLDKEETWQRINAQFAGMPDLLQAYLLIASGACDIPTTRMLGQTPAGLSSTGESDVRNYYDMVAVEQKLRLTPAIARLDEVMIRSSLGTDPKSIFYEWNPLWQMNEEEKAKIAKSKADTFKIDVDCGLINSEVLREARINQLIEDGTYPGLELLIEEFGSEEAEPDLTVTQMIPDPTDPTKMIPAPPGPAPLKSPGSGAPPVDDPTLPVIKDMADRIRDAKVDDDVAG